MARKARISKGKTMKPNFFVFCEGKTEVVYVEFLRSLFRVPIQIIPRKSDSNISDKYIDSCKKDYVLTKNDKTFAMFDLDVAGMYERLQKLKGTILLTSNPCFEVWLLLHHEDCKTALTSDECVKHLCAYFRKYKKGVLLEEEKAQLFSNMDTAISRAQRLYEHSNPSSSVYKLMLAIKEYE